MLCKSLIELSLYDVRLFKLLRSRPNDSLCMGFSLVILISSNYKLSLSWVYNFFCDSDCRLELILDLDVSAFAFC